MNLIFYEIKSSLKSSIIWIISLIAAFIVLMLGAYPAYSSAVDEITSLLLNYPKEFVEAFGINIDSLFSYGGFYNFSFMYIGLLGAIMASAIAIGIFAREKRAKCSDFLLTKPISRESIFIKKLLSSLAIIVAANIIYIFSAVVIYKASGDDSVNLGTLVLAIMGLFFTQLVFLSFGIVFATFSKKVRSVSGIATALGFGAFILSSIANVLDDKSLEFIAPLKYFEPISVFDKGSYDMKLVITAVVIIVACVGISFVKFCKGDVHAV